MGRNIAGREYYAIDGMLLEIKRQLRQREGYPFDVDRLAHHLQMAIEGRFPDSPNTEDGAARTTGQRTHQVWKTIALGTHPNTVDLRKTLKAGGYRISDWGSDVLKKVVLSSIRAEIDLVIKTVAELGFPKGATRKEIYSRAQELGLQLCPAEVGPQLRLQYADQPKDERLFIGMEPITDSCGSPRVFDVDHDGGGQWLSGCDGRPGHFWSADGRWVFVAPRK